MTCNFFFSLKMTSKYILFNEVLRRHYQRWLNNHHYQY